MVQQLRGWGEAEADRGGPRASDRQGRQTHKLRRVPQLQNHLPTVRRTLLLHMRRRLRQQPLLPGSHPQFRRGESTLFLMKNAQLRLLIVVRDVSVHVCISARNTYFLKTFVNCKTGFFIWTFFQFLRLVALPEHWGVFDMFPWVFSKLLGFLKNLSHFCWFRSRRKNCWFF